MEDNNEIDWTKLTLFKDIFGNPTESDRNSWVWEGNDFESLDCGIFEIKVELFLNDYECLEDDEDIRDCDFCLEITVFGDYVKTIYDNYYEIVAALEEDNERFNLGIYELEHLDRYEN